MGKTLNHSLDNNLKPCFFADDVPIDSLQLMMDAADGKSGKNKIITDEEITANAFVFILAG